MTYQDVVEQFGRETNVDSSPVRDHWQMISLPILGYVPGGQPGMHEEHVLGHMEVLKSWPGDQTENWFVLRVTGDSMEPVLPGEQSYVIVDRSRQPRHRDIVVARAGVFHDVLIKQLIWQYGGPEAILRSFNPDWEDLHVTFDEHIAEDRNIPLAEIIGVVVAWWVRNS